MKNMFVVQARDINEDEPLYSYVVKNANNEYDAIQIAKDHFNRNSMCFSSEDFEWTSLYLDGILE